MLRVMGNMHKTLQEFNMVVTFRNMYKTYVNLKLDFIRVVLHIMFCKVCKFLRMQYIGKLSWYFYGTTLVAILNLATEGS